jgi:hypothetical protein
MLSCGVHDRRISTVAAAFPLAVEVRGCAILPSDVVSFLVLQHAGEPLADCNLV